MALRDEEIFWPEHWDFLGGTVQFWRCPRTGPHFSPRSEDFSFVKQSPLLLFMALPLGKVFSHSLLQLYLFEISQAGAHVLWKEPRSWGPESKSPCFHLPSWQLWDKACLVSISLFILFHVPPCSPLQIVTNDSEYFMRLRIHMEHLD